MATKELTLPLLHDKQVEIIRDRHRFRVVACGRRWGKTYMAMVGLYCMLLERYQVAQKKQRGWIVAPTFPLVKEDWLTAEIILKDFIVSKKETAMRMDFDKIGFIEFKSADRGADGLIGAGLDAAVLDEAKLIPRDAWEQGIRPALSDKQGRCIFISTPRGRNWFYEIWLREQIDQEYKSWQYPTYTNPYFPMSEWKTIQETTPEMILRQEYLADFLENEATVFKNIERCYRGELEPYKEGESYTFGLDLGKAEDFTVITGIKNSNCQLVYLNKFNKIDWSLQKKHIKGISTVYKSSIWWVDSTGLGDPIEEDLRQSGIVTRDFKFTNESKQELIEQLVVAIEQGLVGIPDFHIYPETKFLIDELKAFGYEILPSGRYRYQAPEGLHDDAVMSLGLAIRGIAYKFYQKKVVKENEPPFHSPAWMEKQWRDEAVLKNSHMPRRLRTRVEALSLS